MACLRRLLVQLSALAAEQGEERWGAELLGAAEAQTLDDAAVQLLLESGGPIALAWGAAGAIDAAAAYFDACASVRVAFERNDDSSVGELVGTLLMVSGFRSTAAQEQELADLRREWP